MYTLRSRAVMVAIGLAIAGASPAYVSAFGYDADMQCTNGQLDYSCQKGTRCPSRKQGGKGTDCVDASSGTQGKCTAFRVCTDMNSDHKRPLSRELQEASGWGGIGESMLNLESGFDFSGFGESDFGDMSGGITDLPGPDMSTMNDAFSGDTDPSNVPLTQHEGMASMNSFGATNPPFGDIPADTGSGSAPPAGESAGAPAAEAAKGLTFDHEGHVVAADNATPANGAAGDSGAAAPTGFDKAGSDTKTADAPSSGKEQGGLMGWLNGVEQWLKSLLGGGSSSQQPPAFPSGATTQAAQTQQSAPATQRPAPVTIPI